MKRLSLTVMLLALMAGAYSQPSGKEANPAAPATYFQPLKWRSIGPFRGGRSVTACGVIGDPLTYYMGTTGGGLWKTEDAGQIWTNISDGYFGTGSVGAVAVSPSHSNIVYCGMGEHAIRGVMTSHGDGVYKSNDAGKTWRKVGLSPTQHIARIVIHPTDPDIVYVAAQGALYSRSEERGIFKSTDGGASWNNVLYVDDRTGCAELSMDPSNPLVLYAAMWEHQRLPWKVISGGPGSGMYKSTDGGATWDKIHNGLPKELGKMAVSVCPSNPDKVYAVIESDSDKEQGGLFVSNDAGKSWTRVSDDHRLVQRAWYYIEVFADPQDENTVYVMSADALRSIDGGKTWETMEGTHGDFHDLWINPDNPRNMVIANDGGAAISFNYGKTWSTQDNMPTAQIYRVNVDNGFPYRLYGGQQDNSSVSIAHREFNSGGIGYTSWTYSAGGESAFLAFDPDNPRYVLGGSYLGTIEVLDTKAEAGTNIMAAPILYLGRDAKDMKYRFNWNAPIVWSKHEPNTYYHGAQYLLRTRDMGLTWEEASPDLTRNEKEKQGKGGGPYTNEAVGAENYGTLSYVVESPHEKGVIWTGSDDGLVHLTRDGGATWQNVTPTGLAECLVNAIEVSPHDPATAYIATTRYKFNDHTPGLYKTTDYGKTWTNISSGIPYGAFTRVVREDDKRKGLLFAGTETGLYISWNDGKTWQPFQLNLPVAPITDLAVRHGDLIAATSGRSFWILDDLGQLRQYGNTSGNFKLYQPEDAVLANGSSELNQSSPEFKGANPLQGVNPANGIVIYYELPEVPDSVNITLEVRDSEGQLVRQYSSQKDTTFQAWDGGPSAEPALTKDKGLNRFVWNMRYSTMIGVPGVYIEGSYRGHKAVPGEYTFTLKMEEQSASTTARILPNPLYSTDAEGYEAYHNIMSSMEEALNDMHHMVNTLNSMRQQIEKVLKELPEEEKYAAIKKEGRPLVARMKEWDNAMVQRKSKAYDDVENFPNRFTADYLFLINQTESDIPRVNTPSRELLQELSAEWEALKARGQELRDKDVPAFNQLLWKAGIGTVWAF
ncbi:MAG: glycosyl hydrolase [Lewinellaceae bacterium]|nr:glycosyl hydrolase [Lewinellaceae bacterium]